jgi:hypothetical protein
MVAVFKKNRGRLQAIGYRMLGSLADAQDAVQQTWLQASRADASHVVNVDAWLTTIVVRVCLNTLRSRSARREEPMGVHVPDPVISPADGTSPEDQVLLETPAGKNTNSAHWARSHSSRSSSVATGGHHRWRRLGQGGTRAGMLAAIAVGAGTSPEPIDAPAGSMARAGSELADPPPTDF